MRSNSLQALFADGLTTVNGWLSCDSAYLAEAMSVSGFDSITVDVQHGMFGMGGAIRLLQGISAGPAVPMARCPSHDPAVIGKLLDAGADGIICPAVDTAEQARAFVSACRFPPTGIRSYGPARAALHGDPGYVRHADATVLTWAMVESATSLANLDEILSVPGLDGIYLGPNDLALSLGEAPGPVISAAAVQAAIGRVLAAAHAAGKVTGLFCADIADARRWGEAGFDLVTPGNDIGILRAALAERIAAVRGDSAASEAAFEAASQADQR